jgi:hypothetical protein
LPVGQSAGTPGIVVAVGLAVVVVGREVVVVGLTVVVVGLTVVFVGLTVLFGTTNGAAVVVAADGVATGEAPVVGPAPGAVGVCAAGAAARPGVMTRLIVTGWSTVTGTPAGSVTTLPSAERTTTTRVMVSSSVTGVISFWALGPSPKMWTPPMAAKHKVPNPSVADAATAAASALRRSILA